MRRVVAKVRGVGFVIWHARHEFYHILIGLVWAWFLRERWGEFNPKWIATAVVGSLLPDIDHLLYFWGHGKSDDYTLSIKQFFKSRQWRALTVFIENGHKHNTSLSYHNIFTMLGLTLLSLVSSRIDWEVGVVLFGAMVLHYLFDVFDDFVQLGAINPNWRRWGRARLPLRSGRRGTSQRED